MWEPQLENSLSFMVANNKLLVGGTPNFCLEVITNRDMAHRNHVKQNLFEASRRLDLHWGLYYACFLWELDSLSPSGTPLPFSITFYSTVCSGGRWSWSPFSKSCWYFAMDSASDFSHCSQYSRTLHSKCFWFTVTALSAPLQSPKWLQCILSIVWR